MSRSQSDRCSEIREVRLGMRVHRKVHSESANPCQGISVLRHCSLSYGVGRKKILQLSRLRDGKNPAKMLTAPDHEPDHWFTAIETSHLSKIHRNLSDNFLSYE